MASPPKKRRRKKRISKWRAFLVLSGFTLAVASIFTLIFVITVIATTPDWHPDSLTNQEQTSIVYDKDGNQIAALHAAENRQVVKSSEIPDLVKQAFIAVEDKRFNDHFGIDPIRIVGSLITDIKTQSARHGASTITMQLARNAFLENPTEKSITRKIREAALAIQLEREYTKDEILTFYLNRIPFGQSSFGIQTAAKTYFGKELKDLTPDEIALLAGLPQAPSAYNPYYHSEEAKDRRSIVLAVMRDAGLISTQEFNEYKDAPFAYVEEVKANREDSQKPSYVGSSYKFPYFVDHVIDELVNKYDLTEEQVFSGGLQIYTTVDPVVQAAAEKEFSNPNNFPNSVDDIPVQGSITVVEPSAGAIRALVGGRDHTTARGLNRATQSPRQPGSTIKPLVVYAPALEKGGFFPGTVLDDMPVSFNAGGSVWTPTNYDTAYKGWGGLITMRDAVRNSVNVYAVKLIDLIGVDYAWNFAKDKLGLPLIEKEKVLSLSLGTNHVTTLDMASAFGVFANNGVRVTSHAIEKVLDSQGNEIVTAQITKERTMKETTAYQMNSMLRSVVTSGTGTGAQFGNWAVAGKTGTTSLDESYGNRLGNPDAWFAGYTPKYSAVVWMGYDVDKDKNHYLRGVYGGGYPAQIWKNVMTAAHGGLEVQTQFKQPPGIVSGAIDTKSGLLPSSLTPKNFIRNEIAAQGDFPTRVSNVWVEKEVDADNPAYLASENTINKTTKVFLNVAGRNPSITWPSDEAPYRIPTKTYEPPTNITPPQGDTSLPVPNLGAVSYDASSNTVSIPVSYPQNSDNLTLLAYVKFPGSGGIQTFTPEAQPGGSNIIKIPLNLDGDTPAPGVYSFWTAFKDDTLISNPSASVSYKITE